MITAQHIAGILKVELELDQGHIFIANQRNVLPDDGKFCVVVGTMSMMPFASNNKLVSTAAGMAEVKAQQIQEVISVKAFSLDTAAVERAPEIVGALGSTYARRIQETVGFRIASIPSTMNDTSFLEGAAYLYRVDLTLAVIRAYEQQKAIGYYDQFLRETRTEKGTA